jgi:hypothetical protein
LATALSERVIAAFGVSVTSQSVAVGVGGLVGGSRGVGKCATSILERVKRVAQ